MSITIDLNDELARNAEQYARSLTALVEDYLRQLTTQAAGPKPLAPTVRGPIWHCIVAHRF